MLYRILSAGIVIFWITMTGLLVRKEWVPEDSSLRKVPLSHVLRLVFQHAQTSDLQLYHQKELIGRARVHPQVGPESRRLVEFSGHLQLNLPGMPRQRLNFSGASEFNAALELQQQTLNLSFREPAGHRIRLSLNPQTQRLSYDSLIDQTVTGRGEYPLTMDSARSWLDLQGLGFALPQAAAPGKSAMNIQAMQSSLQIRGEKIDTYLVSFQQSEQTLLEVHFSQLGQILRARSFLGYSAAPDELAP